MKSAKLISSALAMLLCFVTFAQQKTITGVVSDSSGPLPGANVVVKGTTRGVQTDLDGKYAIQTSVGETLVYSFIGMQDQTKKVGTSNVINVRLTQDSSKLEEVVVLGYDNRGSKSKKMMAQTTISANSYEYDDYNNYRGKVILDEKAQPLHSKQNANLAYSVSSQAAGLNVGSNPQSVVIRGTTSFPENTNPLYIIDGVPAKHDSFKSLNPNDIES
ncbi:MAG: carboxypeptidase-like regulatory domain-containing protein, partial [Bacteroidota bacterium]